MHISKETADSNFAAYKAFLSDTWPNLKNLPTPVCPRDSDRFAVIIEPRIHMDLEYVMRNVMHFLGGGWGLMIFSGTANNNYVQSLVENWGDVVIYKLDFENLTRHQFRNLRKNSDFWAQIPGEFLLCFETDSILCRHGIDNFLEYDYIGAPWVESVAPSPRVRVGNGGLSLRRKSTMIDICESVKVDRIESEDAFFSIHLNLNKDRYNLPSIEEAMRFSSETLYAENPLGIHAAWKYLETDQFQSILNGIWYSN